MFLKNVNKVNFRSWSITTKLMLLYSFSTIGILIVICLFLSPTYFKLTHQAGIGVTPVLVAECFEDIIIALLLSSLGAIVLGYCIAKKGLGRVQEFVTKIDSITANSLHERINTKDWPKELSTLGMKFNVMLDRLHHSFTQLSQFSSDIAHELRNPLHHLSGTAELALSRETSVAEYQQLLESNLEEYTHLTRLIEHLLFLARADHGQVKLNKISVQASDEVLKLIDYYQAMADEKNIKITCEGEAVVFVDPTLLRRVLSNLLSNALRYTPVAGTIVIQIACVNKNDVQIAIKDSGIGIEEAHLPRLFDRFYRIDASRSSQTGGLGLGLSIVKSIVDLHKGRIFIESCVNSGTSVMLQLPRTLQ